MSTGARPLLAAALATIVASVALNAGMLRCFARRRERGHQCIHLSNASQPFFIHFPLRPFLPEESKFVCETNDGLRSAIQRSKPAKESSVFISKPISTDRPTPGPYHTTECLASLGLGYLIPMLVDLPFELE